MLVARPSIGCPVGGAVGGPFVVAAARMKAGPVPVRPVAVAPMGPGPVVVVDALPSVTGWLQAGDGAPALATGGPVAVDGGEKK